MSTPLSDLHNLAYHDPQVNSFITAFRRGEFSTFEDMLVRLALGLADRCGRLEREMTAHIKICPLVAGGTVVGPAKKETP